MTTETIHIRNMCCQRCIEAVTDELQSLGLNLKSVKLGKVIYIESPKISVEVLAEKLKKRGFELIVSKDEEVCEKIKIAVYKIFSGDDNKEDSVFNLRIYLEKEVNLPYKRLADIFSKLHKKTIESYFISHRVEKAKEMIDDAEYSFTEIAFKLGYKSLSHLSGQFKTFSGISMHDYKLKPDKTRTPLDKI